MGVFMSVQCVENENGQAVACLLVLLVALDPFSGSGASFLMDGKLPRWDFWTPAGVGERICQALAWRFGTLGSERVSRW